jgi:hypothetical protein
VAVAVSSGAFVLVSITGVGVAADRALPGEFLYPLDRTLETLGISSDLVEERLQEAIALLERGEMALAIATSNEALAELGRSGVTATLPPVTIPEDVTGDTVEEVSTTTTEHEIVEVAPDQDDGDIASTSEVVEAAAEPVDAAESLRLAAEQLLQSVRSAKVDPTTTDDVTSAALVLAEATASISTPDEPTGASTDESTTSTSSSSSTSTTSTTVPDEPRPGGGNGNNDSGTTSTTVASDSDDGSDDSTGDGKDDSPGPIFLPSP